jgi:hypothetical protein
MWCKTFPVVATPVCDTSKNTVYGCKNPLVNCDCNSWGQKNNMCSVKNIWLDPWFLWVVAKQLKYVIAKACNQEKKDYIVTVCDWKKKLWVQPV